LINTYTYTETTQSKLHEFVMAFFNRIEFETGGFSTEFYVKEFYDNLVSHHKTILGKAFKNIYSITKDWEQIKRTEYCNAIRRSNEIKDICEGTIVPWKTNDIPEELRELTKILFIKLYEDVLKGKFFQPIYGTRKAHFQKFKQYANNGHEFCPACGIMPLHAFLDDIRDQYDHYLPKDLYPFSSVNFRNLVPICKDCNSLEVKSSKDILSYTGKVFDPFNEAHKPIHIDVEITKNNTDISKIEWGVNYSSEEGKNEEVEAWKTIYNIESRHKTHIKGNIDTWYKYYWEDFNDRDSIRVIPNEAERTKGYLRKFKSRRILEHNSLEALINSFDVKARAESKVYSRY
jgi:hypothetical protein